MGPSGDGPELWGLQAMCLNYGASRQWARITGPPGDGPLLGILDTPLKNATI